MRSWWIQTGPARLTAKAKSSSAPACRSYYNAPDKHLGGMTTGGQSVVVDEDFVLRVPANLNLAAAAPLLCAGIYDLLSAAPGEDRQRSEGGSGWPWRARTHGGETCGRVRSECGCFYYEREQDCGRNQAWSARSCDSKNDSEMLKHVGTLTLFWTPCRRNTTLMRTSIC